MKLNFFLQNYFGVGVSEEVIVFGKNRMDQDEYSHKQMHIQGVMSLTDPAKSNWGHIKKQLTPLCAFPLGQLIDGAHLTWKIAGKVLT